jgi:hypothetical protein
VHGYFVHGTRDIPIRDDSWLPLRSFPLFGESGLAFPNCKDHSSTGSAISRFAMTRWTTSCRDLSRWLRSLPRVPRTDGPDRLSLFRGFRYQVHMSTEFPIPRIPTLRLADSWPLTMALSSLSDVRSAGPTHRGFGLRDFEMQRFRVHEIPDMSIPDFLRISDTRPKWMDGPG